MKIRDLGRAIGAILHAGVSSRILSFQRKAAAAFGSEHHRDFIDMAGCWVYILTAISPVQKNSSLPSRPKPSEPALEKEV
jgi:hypothetical protein